MLLRQITAAMQVPDATVPRLDPSVLGALCEFCPGNGTGILKEVVGIFLEDAPAHLRAVETAVATGDRDALRSRAHSIKGSAANVGAVRLSKIAASLEQSLKDGEHVDVIAALAFLEEEFDAVRVEMRRMADAA
jgi:HPt (histidine-containing phosphotransfer) domain-containing protein